MWANDSHEACPELLQDKSLHQLLIHGLNFLLGLPTHAYVMWLMVRRRRGVHPSDVFPFNISLCDFFFSVRSLLATLSTAFPALFAVVQILAGFNITGRLFQCLMCVERFLAVVHPVTFLKLKPLRYRIFCCSVAWMMIFGSCVYCLHLSSSCSFQYYKNFYLLQFLLFLTVNVFCLVSVLLVLRRSGPGERKEENHRKRRAFLIILITTATLLITYVPSVVVALQHILAVSVSSELESLRLVCFMMPGFVQPLLYIHRTGNVACCRRW